MNTNFQLPDVLLGSYLTIALTNFGEKPYSGRYSNRIKLKLDSEIFTEKCLIILY